MVLFSLKLDDSARAFETVVSFLGPKTPSVCKMKRVLEMDGKNGCTTWEVFLIPVKHTLRDG